MKTVSLTSLQHPIVKRFVKLREDGKFRLSENSALVTGSTLIQEISSRLKIKKLISVLPLTTSAESVFLANQQILRKIIGFSSEDLVAAEVELPKPPHLKNFQKIIVLDQISDPGNVGMIMRTSLALGFDGIFCITPTADPFNDKVIRTSRGACFFLPLLQGSWEDLKTILKENEMMLYFGDLKGDKLASTVFKAPLALLLGHETRGPSPTAKEIGIPIVIPISSQMESLNVACAAAILMYQIQAQT